MRRRPGGEPCRASFTWRGAAPADGFVWLAREEGRRVRIGQSNTWRVGRGTLPARGVRALSHSFCLDLG